MNLRALLFWDNVYLYVYINTYLRIRKNSILMAQISGKLDKILFWILDFWKSYLLELFLKKLWINFDWVSSWFIWVSMLVIQHQHKSRLTLLYTHVILIHDIFLVNLGYSIWRGLRKRVTGWLEKGPLGMLSYWHSWWRHRNIECIIVWRVGSMVPWIGMLFFRHFFKLLIVHDYVCLKIISKEEFYSETKNTLYILSLSISILYLSYMPL